MLPKKLKKVICGLSGEIFLTPGHTETNNFFSLAWYLISEMQGRNKRPW